MKLTKRLSQNMYIIEAAVEYLIALLMTPAFLATIAKEIGISDALTGIVSSFVSLGCLFQLISLFFQKVAVKRFVILLSVINQLLFAFLYLIPLIPTTTAVRTVLFAATVFSAYLIYNLAHPKKIAWMMSHVDDDRRGVFTANKEIISLVAGAAFQYVMGFVIDSLNEKGMQNEAFLVSMATIAVLCIVHTLTMVFTAHPQEPAHRDFRLKNALNSVFKNRRLLRAVLVFVLWNIAYYGTHSFFGTYQKNELGFSLTTVAVYSIGYSLARIAVSRLWGRLADNTSFLKVVHLCLYVAAAGYAVNIFTVPSNGKLFYGIYYLCMAVAQGGINSALINMIFDYAPPEHRSDAMAVGGAIPGVIAFGTSLLAGVLVDTIQKNGNRLFGISLYAQQLLSLLAVGILLIALVYTAWMLKKERNRYES